MGARVTVNRPSGSRSKRLTYASALALLLWIVFVTILIWLAPQDSTSGSAIDMLP